MRNKVFKYIKVFISVALILSLVAPSYASLSASDGSAFVTKAEFDSALADFNSRLTTFEAGINSKIDSQVTSYLDRNGIWNGKEQDYVRDKIWIMENNVAKSYFGLPLSQNIGSYTLSYDWHKTGSWQGTTFVAVPRINKTGLCNIEWSMNPWTSNEGGYLHNEAIVIYSVTGGGAKSLQILQWCSQNPYGIDFECGADGKEKEETVAPDSILFFNLCFNKSWNNGTTYVGREQVSLPHGAYYANCFVEKNKPLYIGYAWLMGTVKRYTIYTELTSSGKNNQSFWVHNYWMEINKCVVY